MRGIGAATNINRLAENVKVLLTTLHSRPALGRRYSQKHVNTLVAEALLASTPLSGKIAYDRVADDHRDTLPADECRA